MLQNILITKKNNTMPSENLSINEASTSTQTATINTNCSIGTSINTSSWVPGTTSTHSYLNLDGSVNIGYFNTQPIINPYYYPKDGEIKFDPDTGESNIYIQEYMEWISCDVLEIRKSKDKENIVSVTFDISVARIKKHQLDRKVFVEKISKPRILDSHYGFLTGTTFVGATAIYPQSFTLNTMPNWTITNYNNTTNLVTGTNSIGGTIGTSNIVCGRDNIPIGETFYNTDTASLNIVIDTQGTIQQI